MDDMKILVASLAICITGAVLCFIGFRKEIKLMKQYEEILSIKEE